jgi:multidrug efflux pump subunit AcrA (membrane-fusion protein)
VIAVNPKAIAERDGKKLVLRINGDTVEAVPVTLGRKLGDVQEVTGSSLKSADRVVLSPDAKLNAGDKIRVVSK